MECEEEDNQVGEPAVNSIILDYYKKFGRKRDLEQYFSLSTAQGDVRDPTGVFWKNMKSHSDSSDSDGKKSYSSQELCRISIKCSVPEPSSSQDENTKTKSDSISPPIITEDLVVDNSRHDDEESGKSEDEHSQKSLDVMLDTSANKPLSPTSSVTSQRKLEWDSLADVGYGNESDRKTSASSLSTLERMALHQQYSNNDTKESLGPPTAQSTPFDETDNKSKARKGIGRKTTKFYKKDVDFVEVNVPQGSSNASQAINVNLTKHISFNVEKDGGVTVENIKKDVSVSPEKVSVETEVTPQIRFDKEIQTSLTKSKDKSTNDTSKTKQLTNQKVPILISLNTLKNRYRKKKIRISRRKLKIRKREIVKRSTPPIQERSGEQLSAAESFEYMPGHIYNQNHLKGNQSKSGTTVGNKSSLESSGGLTTDSSKGSKISFTKDLEKSIDLLKAAMQGRYDDNILKKKLVKQVVQRLLETKYRDDDSTTDFLSGLSFSSKKIGLRDSNSTSTSDANSTATRPKKSILRMDKFNASAIASTSQSAPNLPAASNSDRPVRIDLVKHLTSSNTDTEMSSREKVFDNSLTKATSEEIYKKYLQALKREEAYKKHLRDKEMFLKQKLTNSDSAFKVPNRLDVNVNKRLKDVMKDLTRNNYDDGSGDASKLEGGSDNADLERYASLKGHQSHSVFTLSSGNSECANKKLLKKKLQNDIKDLCKPGPSHYCCCPHHSANIKIGVTDSSVQVNIKDQFEAKEIETKENKDNRQSCHEESSQNTARIVSDNVTGDIKYVCLCTGVKSQEVQDNFLIYKCSRLTNRGVQEGDSLSRASKICGQSIDGLDEKSETTSSKSCLRQKVVDNISSDNIPLKRSSKSSQTNLLIKMVCGHTSDKTATSSGSKRELSNLTKIPSTESKNDKQFIHEATRCIQTEISINPQIADPSLSDINIVSEADCVKLISEQYKEVKNLISKTDLRSREWQSDAEAGTSTETGRNRATSEDSVEELLEDVRDIPFFESDANKHACDLLKISKQDVVTENFTIPIQGTNMKLMVSIGSNERRELNDEKIIQESSKGVGTEQRLFVEESTSLLEECSKGVQYRNDANVLTDKSSNAYIKDMDNKSNSISGNKNIPTLKGCLVNTCMTQDEPKYNTYPMNVASFEKKPFLRSNTDTGVLGSSSIQTDSINKKDMSTQQDFAFGDTCVKPKHDELTQDIVVQKSKGNQIISENILTDTVYGKQIGVQTDATKDNSDGCRNEKDKIKERNNIPQKPPCNCEQQLQNTEVFTKSKIPANYKVQQSCSGTATDSHESEKSKSTTNEECIRSFKNKKNEEAYKDPVLSMIKNITKRYSKDDIEQSKRKKCFKEIVTVLNYLLDTDESTDREPKPTTSCTESSSETIKPEKEKAECCQTKTLVDKAVQSSKNKGCRSTVSSELPTSTDIPGTSSDSATCKVLSKIKKECEKYHQKRCKSHTAKKCEISSTTSVSCDQCRRVHHCPCRYHKCKHHRSKSNAEKAQKKSVAYNLIIQTSESMISEETCDNKCRPLQNIIVKVPSKKKVEKVPFKEVESKIEKRMYCSPRCDKSQRSRSLPNECDMSSNDDCLKRAQACTVREYLEINRPDFVEKCSQRQNNLKVISESRANERAAHRDLLSMHLDQQLPLNALNVQEIRHLAAHFGIDTARKNRAPKFISERDMKKHSEKIYKSLPEVVRKKEEIKKENIKKTNLLMANIFKKNLQKKTLRGAVNLSNYSTVIKI
ncbi:uncharacterized protein LOC115447466 [Manduca sexta]|uniref:uncharacterized protein LOC115447466 n=1 Tax=Manduca sexta TaxID=7130 RepID=UPI00188DD0EA|nr:uncharacterized protein LOC115447466 [Manduca sexta]